MFLVPFNCHFTKRAYIDLADNGKKNTRIAKVILGIYPLSFVICRCFVHLNRLKAFLPHRFKVFKWNSVNKEGDLDNDNKYVLQMV